MFTFNHKEEKIFKALGVSEETYDAMTEKISKVLEKLDEADSLSEEIEVVHSSDLTRDEVVLLCILSKRAISHQLIEARLKLELFSRIGSMFKKDAPENLEEN